MHRTGRTRRWWSVVCAALVTAIMLAGCTAEPQDGEVEAPVEDDQSAEPSRSVPAFVSISVSGALAFEWADEVPLQIVTLTPDERAAHLLSVGVLDPVPVSADRAHEQFRFAFDLVGGYDGEGTYTIPAASDDAGQPAAPPDAGATDTSYMSSAFIVFVSLADPGLEDPYVEENFEDIQGFSRALQDCVIEVAQGESSGSLACPELADDDGNTVRLDVEWRLIE